MFWVCKACAQEPPPGPDKEPFHSSPGREGGLSCCQQEDGSWDVKGAHLKGTPPLVLFDQNGIWPPTWTGERPPILPPCRDLPFSGGCPGFLFTLGLDLLWFGLAAAKQIQWCGFDSWRLTSSALSGHPLCCPPLLLCFFLATKPKGKAIPLLGEKTMPKSFIHSLAREGAASKSQEQDCRKQVATPIFYSLECQVAPISISISIGKGGAEGGQGMAG